ncbi:MAG: hypothetical protein LBJ11_09235 [Oscillospiraceae bacterium]|nr:hypothetical protein [Oscillospiraceae bacterium]
MPDILVRRAAEGDIPRMIELLGYISALHCELRPDMFREAQKFDAAWLRKLFKTKDGAVFVAEAAPGQPIAGYLIAVIRQTAGHTVLLDHRTLWVEDLCSAPAPL